MLAHTMKRDIRVRGRRVAPKARVRDRAGSVVRREFVQVPIEVTGLWRLAGAINLRAFGREAPAGTIAPRVRVPLWTEDIFRPMRLSQHWRETGQ